MHEFVEAGRTSFSLPVVNFLYWSEEIGFNLNIGNLRTASTDIEFSGIRNSDFMRDS